MAVHVITPFSNIYKNILFFFPVHLFSQMDLDTMHPIVKNAIYAETNSVNKESKRKVQ